MTGAASRAIVSGMVLCAVLAAPVDAAAQSAERLYREALAREQTLRVAPDPEVSEYRSLIRAYEAVVRGYPRSGYSDNALWQAAGLARDLHERAGNARDRERAVRFLQLIVSEYPSSSLVAGAILEVARLSDRAGPPDRRASASIADRSVPEADAAPVRSAPVVLQDITRIVLPEVVRVVIELDAEVPFRHERIEDPTRVFVDLQNTIPSEPLRDTELRFGDDIVRQVRTGRHPPSMTRVVLDLDGLANYSVYTLYEPFRVVIDAERAGPAGSLIAGPSDAQPAAALPAPAPEAQPVPPAPNAEGGFSIGRQLGLGASRIVIDPGHGGRDPGAQRDRLSEAEIVLDIALRLEKLLLMQPATEVLLTRRTDAYVALEERTAIANRQQADLFLSIHVNASRNTKTRGVETYFLNFATTQDAETVAARENAASGRNMNNLPGLIRSITLNNKRDESQEFATLVQRALVMELDSEGLQDLGVKQAPFVVLIGAEMPSILAEVAFITNRRDQQLLEKASHRQEIAEALLAGVLQYQQTLKATRNRVAQQ
jgi:N-acetylmuramoyl-L-alanine amidase